MCLIDHQVLPLQHNNIRNGQRILFELLTWKHCKKRLSFMAMLYEVMIIGILGRAPSAFFARVISLRKVSRSALLPWYMTTGSEGVLVDRCQYTNKKHWPLTYHFWNSLAQLRNVERGATTKKGPVMPLPHRCAKKLTRSQVLVLNYYCCLNIPFE